MACNINVESILGQGIFATTSSKKLQAFPSHHTYKANVISCVAIGPTPIPQLPWKLVFHEKERQSLLSNEKFGIYGGKFVPETLISPLTKLDYEFNSALRDPQFQVC